MNEDALLNSCLEEFVSSMYQLDPEFSEILYSNLWELYES